MNRCLIFLTLLAACGGGATTPERNTTNSAPPQAAYDLHEWGLLSVRQGSVELAAGPGRMGAVLPDPMLTVDKPVIYLHANAPSSVRVSVELGPGYEVAERWPGNGELAWNAEITGAPCETRSPYPASCESVDGYCETAELPAYQTEDASCLHVDNQKTSLLFYRLRAQDVSVAHRLPLQVANNGHFRSTSSQSRRVWRLRRSGDQIQAASVEVGSGEVALPEASGDARAAASWVNDELARLGLTADEQGAFRRAWWQALFAIAPEITDLPPDGVPTDVLTADSPVQMTDETVLDEDGEDGEFADDRRVVPGPSDCLIYFLTAEEIDSIARLNLQPAARSTHRAFLVRVEI